MLVLIINIKLQERFDIYFFGLISGTKTKEGRAFHIFEEDELEENATYKDFLQVQKRIKEKEDG